MPRALLAPYKAVIFLSPSGEILDSAQKSAFRKFIRAGNGFIGIHNATAYVLEGWGRYDSLVCARYESEIPSPIFHLTVVDKNHPSTSDLPTRRDLADEDTYNFKANPNRLGATVLVNLDETGLDDGIRYAIGSPGTGLRNESRAPIPSRSRQTTSPRPATTPLFTTPGKTVTLTRPKAAT